MKTKAMKTGMLVGLLALSASLLGCAVQTKWGARDVAFDFSDHDYYDKSFAPSSLAASHTLEGIDSVASGTNEQQVSGTAAETTR